MKLIVGLGNPGKEYEATRHNVGFRFVDALAAKLGSPPFALKKKFMSEVAETYWKEEPIILAKPQTFMNSSGEAVTALANFYRVTPANLWLIYDDIDLPLGKIRLRKDGSAGTHNGMKSVIEILGHQNFPRIRIGIESRGASAPKEQDIASFVLHAFDKKEQPLLEESLKKAEEAFVLSLEKGVEAAMEKANG